MSTHSSNRFAVVADGRSLMRDLLRFLLEQQGFAVANEVSTGAAAVEAVADLHPDIVILHEALALESPDAIQRMRQAAPKATVIVLTANRELAPPSLTEAADAVVEEGAGLQDLAAVLAAGAGVAAGGWTPRPAPRPSAARSRGQRWTDRLQGAVAASILMLAVVFATSVETQPPVEGLDGAYDSLEALAAELPEASVEQAVSLATTLISERAMLRAASVDVTALDADIAEAIAPILPTLSPEVARALRELLGDLLIGPPSPSPSVTPTPEPTETEAPSEPDSSPTETPAPATEPPAAPTESPSPSPTDSPSPSPTESPSPSPTESPSPSPTDSPSPSPTESPSPSPTESPSPSPTDSPSPSPTESPSPSPTDSPSPSPTESPSPSPTETPSPTESPSPTDTATPTDPPPSSESPTAAAPGAGANGGNGAILVVPPGLVVLLGSSGAARLVRRRRR